MAEVAKKPSGTSGYQFSEETIKCRICSKPYTKPKSLPCLHSFCTECLRKYIKDGFPAVQLTSKKNQDKNAKPAESPTKVGQDEQIDKKASLSPTNIKSVAGTKTPVNKPKQGEETDTKGLSPTPQIKAVKDGALGAKGAQKKDIQQGKTTRKQPVTKARESPKKDGLKVSDADKNTRSPSPIEKIGRQGTITLETKQAAIQNQNNTKPQDSQKTKKAVDSLPGKQLKGFPCPCCRKFVTSPGIDKAQEKEWPDLLPDNKLLSDLVDLHSLKKGNRTCDPCNHNNEKSEVKYYCRTCRDALCVTCFKTHEALKSCRQHKVLNMNELSAEMNTLKAEEESCPKHESRLLEHYCPTHGVTCCSECVRENHKACDKVVNVTETVSKLKSGKDISTIEDALMKYKAHTDIVLKDRAAQVKKLEGKKDKLLDDFVGVKKNIIAQLDKMEADLRMILESTHKSETKRIRQEAEKCNEIKMAVLNSKEILNLAINHGSDSQLITTVENVKGECEFYEENLDINCSKIRAVDYDIKLDPNVQQLIKRLNQFGQIDVKTSDPKLPPTPKVIGSVRMKGSKTKDNGVPPLQSAYNIAGKRAIEIGEFCARSSTDSEECWFTGAKFLPDGRIVIADRTNRKLKLFSKSFDPINEVALSSKPWDVTVISEKEVAVSLPAECMIEFITIQGTTMAPTRNISTDEPCFGICYVKDKLLTVTYDGDPPNLKILSLTGEELTYVCVDDDGFNLFSKPVYVTSNKDASQIYVSDERLGCLVNLTETGTLNFSYSAMDLGHAAGIALDHDDNLYVCGNTSNTVHVVSPKGDRLKVLVTKQDISYPRAIAFEPKEKKLLITQGDNEMVKMYSLK